MNKQKQKQLITDIMNEDAKDGLYKQKTAVEWLVEQIEQYILTYGNLPQNVLSKFKKQAKEMEKEQIEDAFGVGCHHESKRLVGYQDIAEQYYNHKYGGNK